MTTPEHAAEPLAIELVLSGDPSGVPGQARVAEVWVNGHQAAAPNQLVYVGTEIRLGEPLLVNLQVEATIVTTPTEAVE